MKKKTAVIGGSLLLAFAVVAMPTEKELAEARGIVAELMSGPASDQKAGRITNAQLAEKAMVLADAAETDAAKLLLVRGAVLSFARDGESARAAAALAKLRADVKDLSPDFEADVLARAVKALPPSDDKTLYGMLDDARRLVKCRQDVPILEKRLARREDPAMRGQLAECLASLGDWKRALEEFAKIGGEVSRVAKSETGAGIKMPSAEIADFWWNYPGIKDSSGFSVFQRHAVEWYGAALKDGSLTGLKRNLAEKRIADVGAQSAPAPQATPAPQSAPVARNAQQTGAPLPTGRPKDITLKLDNKESLDLIGIPAGSFLMGIAGSSSDSINKPRKVNITRPFWFSKYPLTFGAFLSINPRSQSYEKRKSEAKHFDERGVISLNQDDIAKVFEILNERFTDRPRGYVYRCPTAAEWEYVYKAGNSDDTSRHDLHGLWETSEMREYLTTKRTIDEKCLEMGGGFGIYLPIQLTKPNSWNVWAFGGFWGCALLDMVDEGSLQPRDKYWIGSVAGASLSENDPLYRGGSCHLVRSPRAFYPGYVTISRINNTGVRIVLGPDLLAEAKGGGGVSAPSASSGVAAPAPTAAVGVQRPGMVDNRERPKDISFKLNARESLEMVGIPSGTFTMGLLNKDLGALVKPRKVEITRPFWFSKYPLTIAGVKALNVLDKEAVRSRLNRPSITEDCCCGLRIDETENVLKRLNRRFTNRPKGYVFRFPTAAEYERAFKAEKGDVVDPDGLNAVAPWRTKEVLDYRKSRSFPEKLGPSGDWQYCIPVRLPRPNAWGIGAMGEAHGCFLLDTYDHDTVVLAPYSRFTIFGFKGIDAIGTKDPVFTCRSGDVHHLAVGGTDSNRRAFVYINSGTQGLRIVLGPDLEAEAKAGK